MKTSEKTRFSGFAIANHWLIALATCGLLALGLYMVRLDYYHPWYSRAPSLHESIGLLLAAVLLARLVSRYWDSPPAPLASLKPAEKFLASAMHRTLYLLLMVQLGTGYLISSADGIRVAFFSLFTLPPFVWRFDGQEEFAGLWHEIIAWILIALGLLLVVFAIVTN